MNRVKLKDNGYENIRQFEYDIKGNNFTFQSEDNICLSHLAKYLIETKGIHLTPYRRKSPYKIIKQNYELHHPSLFYSEFVIEFFELTDKQLVLKQNKVLRTNTHSIYAEKSFTCFIPDLLEVFVERGWLSNIGDGYSSNMKYIAQHVIFEDVIKLISPEELQSKGYKVPIYYRCKYNNHNQ